MKNVSEALKNFSRANLSSIQHRAKPQFHELTPAELLNFSTSDEKSNSLRGSVNSTASSSRALELRLDELIHNWGFKQFSEKQKYVFADKMGLMRKLGVLSAYEEKTIIKLRNLLEDHYVQPDQDTLKDYIASVSLFLKFTDRLLNFDSHCEIVKSGEPEEWLVFNIDQTTSSVVLLFFELYNEDTKKKPKKSTLKLKLNEDNFDEYISAIKWYLRLLEK